MKRLPLAKKLKRFKFHRIASVAQLWIGGL
jgi:hypothetical protein